MTVNISKDSINIREKLSELDKPSSVAGEAILKARTHQEQFELIGAGRKNLIINGDMRIAQRGATSTLAQSNKGYKTVDRFKFWEQGTPTAVFDVNQETLSTASSPNTAGEFNKSTRIVCTTRTVGPDPYTAYDPPADSHVYMSHFIEGSNLQHLGWGTPKAKPLTLSFYVRGTSGTYVVPIRMHNGTDEDWYTGQYAINSQGGLDDWRHVEIHIPARTDTRIRDTSDFGFEIRWVVSAGTDWTSGVPLLERTPDQSAWADSPATNRIDAGQTGDIAGYESRTWEITGIQLEVGNHATPFEHISIGEQLALCQRYYQRNGSIPGKNEGVSVAYSTNRLRGQFQSFATTMRTDPTMTVNNAEYYGTLNSSDQWITPTAVSVPEPSVDGFCLDYTAHAQSTFSTSVAHPIQYGWEADAEL